MTIIMLALEGEIHDFYNLLTALSRTVSNTYAQTPGAQSCANHVQHIRCLSHAASRVPRGTKGQLNYQGLTELNRIYFSYIFFG